MIKSRSESGQIHTVTELLMTDIDDMVTVLLHGLTRRIHYRNGSIVLDIPYQKLIILELFIYIILQLCYYFYC